MPMVARLLALFALSAAVAVAREEPEGTPVDKVVDLIEELKGKLETDASTEQAAFDKLACWCEEITDKKAKAIEAAMVDLKRLGTNILELKGQIAVLTTEIDELKKETAENEKAQTEATKLREQNNKKFLEEKAEMEATIGSLEKAILVLSGAGTKKASLLEEKAALQTSKRALQSAVEALPVENNLSPEKMKMLSAFLQDPAEYYDKKAEKSAAYSPASSTIQGLLKDMYDTFVSNLEKETVTESDQQQQFEDLISAKTKEKNTLLATTEAKASEKAEAEVMLADSSEEMDDTSNVMKADTKFFDDTKAECTTKADEWSERVRARTEEMAGIDKALAILTSDDAKALFAKAIKPGKETMLLQEGMEADGKTEKPLVKAAEVLKKQAKKAKSLRLATLATQVRDGHFRSVVIQIEKMEAVLKKEEQDDMDTKDWCKAETFKNEEEASQYEYKVEKMIAKVEKLEDQVTAMEATVDETVKEMEDTRKAMTQMEDERKSEHEAFAEAKADDEGAIALLESAIASMSSFYGNNKGAEMGEIQGSVKLIQQDPEKPEFAPSDAGSRKGESKGIVSILTMLKEDLQDEVKNGVKDEMASQKAFEEEMKKANDTMDRLRARKANLRDSIATANQSIDDAHGNKDNFADLKTKDEEYLAEIKPDCMWMLENFDARRSSRAEEYKGLDEARALLEGAVPAFVQKAPTGKAFLQVA